jgi:hypothetical protein
MGTDTGYEDEETNILMELLDKLYDELDPKMYGLVSKIVNIEIELESRCNI